MIYTDGTHLVSTNIEELHLFASSIGLKRAWFQEHDKHPHYDTLSGSTKHRAIAAGAVLVSSKKIVEMFRLLEERDRMEYLLGFAFLEDQKGYLDKIKKLNYQLNNLHLCDFQTL